MSAMTSREFNRDVSAAKRAAHRGPVVITDRGEAAFVLLSYQDYQRMAERRSIVEWLQAEDDVDFEPARLDAHPRAADL